MLPGEIRGDAAFTAFQVKLAAIVINAPTLGKKVGEGSDCCCPLGAHPDALTTYPASTKAQLGGWAEVPLWHLIEFINGWHGLIRDAAGFRGPYADLGAAYREMFSAT